MAYLANVVAFGKTCIATDEKDVLYNYVVTSDLTMNKLVSPVRTRLKGDISTGSRLPYRFGLIWSTSLT
jgi:hypothetical protein